MLKIATTLAMSLLMGLTAAVGQEKPQSNENVDPDKNPRRSCVLLSWAHGESYWIQMDAPLGTAPLTKRTFLTVIRI